MTNADKYLKDGVDVEELFNDLKSYNDKIKGVTNYYTRDLSIKFLKEFLSQPAKPILTEDEKVILRELMGCENYIGRKDNGTLYLKTVAGAINYFGFYLHLFKFIKNGEEYKISDLLEE